MSRQAADLAARLAAPLRSQGPRSWIAALAYGVLAIWAYAAVWRRLRPQLRPIVRQVVILIGRLIVGLAGIIIALHESVEPTLEIFKDGSFVAKAVALTMAGFALFDAYERARKLYVALRAAMMRPKERGAAQVLIGLTTSTALHAGVFWLAALPTA